MAAKKTITVNLTSSKMFCRELPRTLGTEARASMARRRRWARASCVDSSILDASSPAASLLRISERISKSWARDSFGMTEMVEAGLAIMRILRRGTFLLSSRMFFMSMAVDLESPVLDSTSSSADDVDDDDDEDLDLDGSVFSLSTSLSILLACCAAESHTWRICRVVSSARRAFCSPGRKSSSFRSSSEAGRRSESSWLRTTGIPAATSLNSGSTASATPSSDDTDRTTSGKKDGSRNLYLKASLNSTPIRVLKLSFVVCKLNSGSFTAASCTSSSSSRSTSHMSLSALSPIIITSSNSFFKSCASATLSVSSFKSLSLSRSVTSRSHSPRPRWTSAAIMASRSSGGT